MRRAVGKRIKFEACFVAIDDKLATKKVLLRELNIDGFEKSHAWIEGEHLTMLNHFKVGSIVRGTTRLCEYIGLDEHGKQVTKIGLANVKIHEIDPPNRFAD